MRSTIIVSTLLSFCLATTLGQTGSDQATAAQAVSLQTATASADSQKSRPLSIDGLRRRIHASETKVNELVTALPKVESSTASLVESESSTVSLVEFERLVKLLLEETRRLFELQTTLHRLELDEAEARIAVSRKLLDERIKNADEILNVRVKSLLDGTAKPKQQQETGDSRLIGQWQTKLFLSGGNGSIINSRLVPDEEVAAFLQDAISHEELVEGPWILEVEETLLCLRHQSARLPVFTLEISNIDEGTFAVDFKSNIASGEMATFLGGETSLENIRLQGQYRIEGTSLKLSVDEVGDDGSGGRLSPLAGIYFECERYVGTPANTLPLAVDLSRSSPTKQAVTTEERLPEWDDFLKLLPESGASLVMFDDSSERAADMQRLAKRVAEEASIPFRLLPQTRWRRIIDSSGIHFVLMKDGGIVASRTGLMTERRLKEFVKLAEDWLTLQSAGVDENSLVQVDCFISPGRNNIGSQHGGAYPMTTVVVAVDEDQVLLLGADGIAEWLEKGYECVALVRDASGEKTQVALDVVLTGPVSLHGRSFEDEPMISFTATDGEGNSIDVPLATEGYPASMTQPQEAYDTGMAVYQIQGAHGLIPVQPEKATFVSAANDSVLSVGFRRPHQAPPLSHVTSPLEWQSQRVKSVDDAIYGINNHGPHLITVECPTRPAPSGFTFTSDGRLLGKYALGSPSDDDMTHTVHQPYTIRSVLKSAVPKIESDRLKSSLELVLKDDE